MAHDDPRHFTSSMAKRERINRTFIDWMRNSRGATTATPWSVRARSGAPVAVPLLWDELSDIPRGDLMTISDVLDYARTTPADPWRDLLDAKQRITRDMVASLGSG